MHIIQYIIYISVQYMHVEEEFDLLELYYSGIQECYSGV